MKYEATGKLVKKLPVQSGTSKTGKDWEKQEFVIETDSKYDPNLCFNLFGEDVAKLSRISEGETITVGFYLSSKEYNGRWFHNLQAKDVDVVLDQQQYSDGVGSQSSDDDSGLPF